MNFKTIKLCIGSNIKSFIFRELVSCHYRKTFSDTLNGIFTINQLLMKQNKTNIQSCFYGLLKHLDIVWAASSEFVSSSIPS